MQCIKCGKALPPGAAFCAHCGAKQAGGEAAAKRGSGAGMAIAAMAAGVAILGGVGYWGWQNYKDKEAARQSSESMALKPVSMPATPQAQLSPDEARERADIVAAQAALAKHIVEEETQAKARSGVK